MLLRSGFDDLARKGTSSAGSGDSRLGGIGVRSHWVLLRECALSLTSVSPCHHLADLQSRSFKLSSFQDFKNRRYKFAFLYKIAGGLPLGRRVLVVTIDGSVAGPGLGGRNEISARMLGLARASQPVSLQGVGQI